MDDDGSLRIERQGHVRWWSTGSVADFTQGLRLEATAGFTCATSLLQRTDLALGPRFDFHPAIRFEEALHSDRRVLGTDFRWAPAHLHKGELLRVSARNRVRDRAAVARLLGILGALGAVLGGSTVAAACLASVPVVMTMALALLRRWLDDDSTSPGEPDVSLALGAGWIPAYMGSLNHVGGTGFMAMTDTTHDEWFRKWRQLDRGGAFARVSFAALGQDVPSGFPGAVPDMATFVPAFQMGTPGTGLAMGEGAERPDHGAVALGHLAPGGIRLLDPALGLDSDPNGDAFRLVAREPDGSPGCLIEGLSLRDHLRFHAWAGPRGGEAEAFLVACGRGAPALRLEPDLCLFRCGEAEACLSGTNPAGLEGHELILSVPAHGNPQQPNRVVVSPHGDVFAACGGRLAVFLTDLAQVRVTRIN
jgi:hypothetical protein